MKIVYPGTFDPITFGHVDLAERIYQLSNELTIAISSNSGKKPLFSTQERVELTKEALKHLKGIKVVSYDNLLVDFLKDIGTTTIVRGLRAVSDFEFEFQLAMLNRQLYKEFETLFLMPNQKYTFISSTIVKDVAIHNGDVTQFVPKNVAIAIKAKYNH